MSGNIEEKLYNSIRDKRDTFVKPLLKCLVFLGFTPDMLSYTGVLLMCLFVYVIKTQTIRALWLLLLTLLIDMLDGALARHTHTASDRGKFTDVLMDSINFTLFIIGLVYAGILSGLVATVYVYFMLLVKVLMIIRKNIARHTDWLIHPMAGAFPNVFVYSSYILFLLYVLFDSNYLTTASQIFSMLLILKAISEYYTIRHTLFKKN